MRIPIGTKFLALRPLIALAFLTSSTFLLTNFVNDSDRSVQANESGKNKPAEGPFGYSLLRTADAVPADIDLFLIDESCAVCHPRQKKELQGSLHTAAHSDPLYRSFAERAQSGSGTENLRLLRRLPFRDRRRHRPDSCETGCRASGGSKSGGQLRRLSLHLRPDRTCRPVERTGQCVFCPAARSGQVRANRRGDREPQAYRRAARLLCHV